MSRLIDADELKRKAVLLAGENDPVYAVPESEIDDQPTAYDVEAVVAELEKEYDWNADCFHGTEGLDYLGQMRAYDNAIRIVKRGGQKERAE